MDSRRKHVGGSRCCCNVIGEQKPRSPSGVASLIRPGLIASRPTTAATSTGPGARRLPVVYGGIQPRVNARCLLSGLKTDRWIGEVISLFSSSPLASEPPTAKRDVSETRDGSGGFGPARLAVPPSV